MEIRFTKKGPLQVLTLRGTFHLQNWKVVDKHLKALLEKDCLNLVLDLSGVTFICTSGVGSLMQAVKKFQDRKGQLLLLSPAPWVYRLLETFGGQPFLAEHVFPDWQAVEKRLESGPGKGSAGSGS